MKKTNHGLRKAAILVACLDMPAADAVLDQLSPADAQRVRDLVIDLGEIDRDEQQRVIDEFFRVGKMLPVKSPAGIELDGQLARRLAERSSGFRPDQLSSDNRRQEGRPFEFLQEAEAEKLSRLLAGERPQTIALVLSHLASGRASAVLARLHPALQVEVIRRLVDLEETDPEVLRAVEEGLQSRLSEQVEMQRRRVAGLQAVAGILQAADRRAGIQILDNLAAHDKSLADRLGPRPIEFDNLADADDDVLAEAFRTAGEELTVVSLVGASPELVDRVIGLLDPDGADGLRDQLDHPGPIRLRDVEEARREIARLAQHCTLTTSH